jgi:hypothetical protein
MATKADHELDPERGSQLKHELQVARYLASAFIAQSHGIGMDYARKTYAHMPVGEFWLDIARQVIGHMAKGRGQPGVQRNDPVNSSAAANGWCCEATLVSRNAVWVKPRRIGFLASIGNRSRLHAFNRPAPVASDC